MNIEQACKKWIDRDFSNIPALLIKKAYTSSELELLTSSCPVHDWPSEWGTLYHPESFFDSEWIKDNLDTVEELGFVVYQADETGILLAINGGGYCFYQEHWIPLYKARGLQWHL